MTCDIDLSEIADRAELHRRLREGLDLPDWYGNNLDALRDVLSEGRPVSITFRSASRANDGLRPYIDALRRMCADVTAAAPSVAVTWLEDESGEHEEALPMSKYLEKARALRGDTGRHYNCAQSVLVPFAADAGLDEETACRVAANFGSGMKRGSVCGAITGGLMALGLYGLEDGPVIAAYHRRLRENHQNALDCAELLRIDRERGGDKKTHCDGMVYECVALAEALLRENGKIQ